MNSLRVNSSFSPFIIGTGLNYSVDDEGFESVNPSISWMMKYELDRLFSIKTNFESTFIKDTTQKSVFISSQADFYLGVKASRELEISLKTGGHFSNDGNKSISYGIEFEHNSKLLRKLNVSSLYVGIEFIPNLTVGKRRVFSGVRFNL